jgi:hypothetical protein
VILVGRALSGLVVGWAPDGAQPAYQGRVPGGVVSSGPRTGSRSERGFGLTGNARGHGHLQGSADPASSGYPFFSGSQSQRPPLDAAP